MKTFRRCAAQGEITLIRIGDLPPKAADEYYDFGPAWRKRAPENGHMIIGHSETGHHHVMDRNVTVGVLTKNVPAGMEILRLIVESPTPIIHLRDHDTHESIMLDPGVYEARIAREFDPYGDIARRVAD
jgi:hypothetical protein